VVGRQTVPTVDFVVKEMALDNFRMATSFCRLLGLNEGFTYTFEMYTSWAGMGSLVLLASHSPRRTLKEVILRKRKGN